jgi:hypothetical protein
MVVLRLKEILISRASILMHRFSKTESLTAEWRTHARESYRNQNNSFKGNSIRQFPKDLLYLNIPS